MKRLILQVRWGPLAYRKAVLTPGQVLKVGRAPPADLVLAHDERLEALHFQLSWDGKSCRLRDLGSRYGTQLGGEHLLEDEEEVPHGGWLRAGHTDFSVYIEATTPPRPVEPPEPETLLRSRSWALERLEHLSGPLFMLADAARGERVLELLRESVEDFRSLYEGTQGEVLAEVAPYLVALPPQSRLLRTLVLEGWGRSWGVFLRCELSLGEVCRHLRQFLMVQNPRGVPLYFRFYDPRVLRAFLSTCTSQEALQFFGPIRAFYLEGSSPQELLRFRSAADGPWRDNFLQP